MRNLAYYVFTFELKGARGNKVQDVVEISMEGVFVGLSLGYSVAQDDRKTPRFFAPVVNQPTTPTDPTLVPFFQNNVDLQALNVSGTPGDQIEVLLLSSPTGGVLLLAPNTLGPPNSVASGRIGPSGNATIETNLSIGAVICAWNRTSDLLSQLFEVGSPATPVIGPDPRTGKLPVAGDTVVHVYGLPSELIEPSSSSATVSLLRNSTGAQFLSDRRPAYERHPDFSGSHNRKNGSASYRGGEHRSPACPRRRLVCSGFRIRRSRRTSHSL